MIPLRIMLTALALGLLGWSSGCRSPYVLRGRVVQGPVSMMAFVAPDSPELEGPGVAGVQFKVYRDPHSLGRKLAGGGQSGMDGAAQIEIRGFGTGWLDESWLIRAVRGGYETAELTAPLPSRLGDRVLLVVMTPGVSIDPVDPRDEIMQDYERFK